MSANNNVSLIGNLVADPEIHRFESGNAVANIRLAVNRVYMSDGVKHEDTLFISCVIFGRRAETIAMYTKKGHRLSVSGELRADKYTNKAGVEVTAIKVVVNDFMFLTQKGDNIQVAGQTFPQPTAAASPPQPPAKDKGGSGYPF